MDLTSKGLKKPSLTELYDVNIVNENTQAINDFIENLEDDQGDLALLQTTKRTNLVEAVNEIEAARKAHQAESAKYNDVGFSQAPINQKVVYKASDNEYRVISRKPTRKGYTLMRFRKGFGGVGSQDTGGTHDLLRLDRVESLSEVVVFEQPINFISSQNKTPGEDDFRLVNFDTGYSFPTKRPYISNSGREAYGAYLEFQTTITKEHNRLLYLGFYSTGGSNKKLSVYLNDSLDDTIDISSPTAKIQLFAFDVGTILGEITVRLQVASDPTANGGVHFLGVNALNLNQIESNLNFNGALWRLESNHYITGSSGANEYAFLDKSTGKWAGSYHGGEVTEDLLLLLDGINISDLPANTYVVGKGLTIIQATNIINKVKAQIVTEIINDSSYLFNAFFDIDNPFLATDFYAAMTCSDTTFSKVIYPKMVTTLEGQTAYLPNAKKVTQLNPTTNQMITTIYSPLEGYKNSNPLYVQHRQYYAKLYHGLVRNSETEMKSMNFGNVKIFD